METGSRTFEAISDALVEWTSGTYDPFEFYRAINGQDEYGNEIARAMDGGTNDDVVREVEHCLRSILHPEDPVLHFMLNGIRIQWF